MHPRLVLAFIALLSLDSCEGTGCQRFADGAVSYCIPSARVLGPVFGLPAPSADDEVGFYVGKNMQDPNVLIVALTKTSSLDAQNGRRIRSNSRTLCRPLHNDAAVSRCFTDGRVGRSAYSVIYYSGRRGGAARARAEVEEALASWTTD